MGGKGAFAAFHRVGQQHGDSHRADTAGNRCNRRGALYRAFEVHISHQFAFHAVDADINNNCAFLEPCALEHLRPADRSNDHIGPANLLGQIAGAGMADGYCGMTGKAHQCHRFAHDIGSADNRHIFAGEIDTRFIQQLENT